MSLLVASAFAQTAAGAADGGGGLGGFEAQLVQFAPLVIIFGVFWALFFRPQQQKQKQTKAMLLALRRGDRVVTGGGIVGTVQRVREGSDEIEVEVAPNVRVTVLRDTISTVVTPKAANDAAPVAAKAN